MKKALFIIVAAVLSSSTMAQSDQERGHPTNGGLYFSISGGGAYLSINDDITNGPYSTMEMKGFGGGFDLKLGAAIKENFILHGDLIGTSSGSINVTVDGDEIGTISGDNSVGTTIFGGGATYYFMPQNIFISGTLGLGGFSITTDGETGNTQKGFGMYMKVGKEWWISKNWDLGFCFAVSYLNVNNETENMTEKLSGVTVGLSFNVTFN